MGEVLVERFAKVSSQERGNWLGVNTVRISRFALLVWVWGVWEIGNLGNNYYPNSPVPQFLNSPISHNNC
ncbi:MAG: hypothetical protein AB4368_07715 [Xenococcaceae cyanobacterium]